MRCLPVSLTLLACMAITACGPKREDVVPISAPGPTIYVTPDPNMVPDCKPKATWVPGSPWADLGELAATFKSELVQCDKQLDPLRQWIREHAVATQPKEK